MGDSEIIYLDNAATTKIDSAVIEKMKIALEEYGNPNSSHELGNRAKNLVEESRIHVANMINAKPEEIIFTSGGTESNNWAVYSSVCTTKKRTIFSSEIEHHSIHQSIHEFRKSIGTKGHFVPVNADGEVDINYFQERMDNGVGLVSIMMANNEIGTIQPIKKLAEIAHRYGILFHTDAVQAAGKIKIDVKDLNVDMLSLSGHKFHGSKGVGILYVKSGINLHPMISGGHQENGYRAGTYNVPGIVGIGEAARLVNSQEIMDEIGLKAQLFWVGMKTSISDIERNGNPNLSVPGVVNVCFKGVEAKAIVLELSKRGVCCSSGSACNEGTTIPSHVLKAIGCSTYKSHSSIRFSFSRFTTKEDIYRALEIIVEVIKEHREKC